MYLARTEPVGPHSEAVKYILRARGDGQLYDSSRFTLSRLAHHRLQNGQILSREQPDPDQIAWVSRLNTNRPDLHLCVDVLSMNILSATAKTLTQAEEQFPDTWTEKLEQAKQLTHKIQSHLETMENWTSEMTGIWTPKIEDRDSIAPPQDVDESSSLPIPYFPCPEVLNYNDVWLV
jgi:hypothetical protein